METLFNHVRRLGNKVAYQLVNLGTETHRAVKANEWSEVMDAKAMDSCINLMHQDTQSSHEMGRQGHREGLAGYT